MEIEHSDPKRPDIKISMTADEGDRLYAMVVEGKAYVSDCGESTTDHETFLEILEPMLAEV
jgi:hypothetical protein